MPKVARASIQDKIQVGKETDIVIPLVIFSIFSLAFSLKILQYYGRYGRWEKFGRS